jgi:hypothetical protein
VAEVEVHNTTLLGNKQRSFTNTVIRSLLVGFHHVNSLVRYCVLARLNQFMLLQEEVGRTSISLLRLSRHLTPNTVDGGRKI